MEIERKFLVTTVPDGLEETEASEISQGYLAIDADSEVRVRRRDRTTTLTVKRGGGRTRDEVEIEIAPEAFERLWPLTAGRRVEKTRHLVPLAQGLTIELDVYAGLLHGLVVAEVEFAGEDEAQDFTPPRWLATEVTDDPRVRNQALACSESPIGHESVS